jgi:hypothetical protein
MRFVDPLQYALAGLLREEAGSSLMEYALVGSLILVLCMLLSLAWRRVS